MFMKFCLFALATLWATQSLQAHSIGEPSNVLDDFLSKIKEIIKKIEETIEKITQNWPNFDEFQEKIKQILNKLNKQLENIIEELEDSIENIIANSGINISQIKQCIKQEKEEEKELIKTAKESVEVCKTNAEEDAEKLIKEFIQLKIKAKDFLNEIHESIKKCKLYTGISNTVECLKEQLSQIKDKTDTLVEQVEDTVQIAVQTGPASLENLTTCAKNVYDIIQENQKDIINNFNKCIKKA